jgi:RND family efflux transporter MFP subunit
MGDTGSPALLQADVCVSFHGLPQAKWVHLKMSFISRSVIFARNVSLLLALAGVAFAAGCGTGSSGNPQAGAPQAMPVQVQVAEAKKIPDTTEYLAVVKSRHSATINPQVEGQIVKIFVTSGDRVKAGTPLLQIDPLKQEASVSSQEAARAAQEANVRLAKVSLERAQKLHEAGIVSRQELDNAQSSHDAAVAQLKALEEQVNQQKAELRYYRITAPKDGVVGDIPVRVGDRVGVTTLLTTVDEPGALEAYIYLPADKSGNAKVGLPVRLLDQAGNALVDSRLTFVSPQVDPETQTVLAKASADNAKTRLRVSQQVRAQITWGVQVKPVIPLLAVARVNGQFFAFVSVSEGKGFVARQKLLKLGELVGNEYAVNDGLKPGDHIIISGIQFLQDGFPVAEQTAAESAPGANVPGR